LTRKFLGPAFVGICAGSTLSKKINEKFLSQGFGWFVLVMGLCIIAKELMEI
jgi:uncharacterized membrane protein YfcA